jgi:purine nucleoside permease
MDRLRGAFRRWRVRGAPFGILATVVVLAAVTVMATFSHPTGSSAAPFKVKVLVVTMFDGETRPWLQNEKLGRTFTVPAMDEPVHCGTDGLCVATIGEGKTNAAASMSAILVDEQLDLTSAYFMTAGVAGITPKAGTLGDADWANWVVDYEIGGHHISKEADPTVPFGYAKGDDEGTTVYHLNQKLVDTAYALTKSLPLSDSADAEAGRAHYAGQAGKKPRVSRCDTVTADDYWTGSDASATAQYVVDQWTNHDGTYCTSQQEDNATAGVLARRGFLSRYLSLRTASDFDQPYPGESTDEVLKSFPGGDIAVANAYSVGAVVAHYLVSQPGEARPRQ